MSDSVKRDTTNVQRDGTPRNPLREAVGAWVRAVIGADGDRKAGERVGVSHVTIYNLRKELSDPTQDTLDRIAAAYEVPAPRLALVFPEDEDTTAMRQRVAAQLREMASAMDLATRPPPRPAE
jgi:transcriptional regulator with XRE-family HTH domain